MENANNFKVRESNLRSLVKSFIYRFLAIIGTAILVWIFTKDISEVVLITVAVQFFLIILYYTNERVWNKIGWGREIKLK